MLVRLAIRAFNYTDRAVLLEALHELSSSEPAPEPNTTDAPPVPPQQSASSSSSSTTRQPIPDVTEAVDDISDTPPPAPPPDLPNFPGAAVRAQLDLAHDGEWLTAEREDAYRRSYETAAEGRLRFQGFVPMSPDQFETLRSQGHRPVGEVEPPPPPPPPAPEPTAPPPPPAPEPTLPANEPQGQFIYCSPNGDRWHRVMHCNGLRNALSVVARDRCMQCTRNLVAAPGAFPPVGVPYYCTSDGPTWHADRNCPQLANQHTRGTNRKVRTHCRDCCLAGTA